MAQMKWAFTSLVAFCLGAVIGALGWQKWTSEAEAVGDHSASVASFRNGHLSTTMLKRELAALGPLSLSQLSVPAERDRFVRALIENRLLVDEAIRLKLDQHPELSRQRDHLLVQALEQQVAEGLDRTVLADAEVKAYYDSHQHEFNRPERVRLAHMFLSAPTDADKSRRMVEAQKLLNLARVRAARDFYAFGDLAREKSEDQASRIVGGELPFMTREEVVQRLGSQVAEAAFGLRAPGEIAGVVVAPAGFHILRLMTREESVEGDVAVLRASIESRMRAERRARALADLRDRLFREAMVEIDTAMVEVAVAASMSSSAAQGVR